MGVLISGYLARTRLESDWNPTGIRLEFDWNRTGIGPECDARLIGGVCTDRVLPCHSAETSASVSGRATAQESRTYVPCIAPVAMALSVQHAAAHARTVVDTVDSAKCGLSP